MANTHPRMRRCLGRDRLARIRRRPPPHGVSVEDWVLLVRMAELYRQRRRRIERRRRKVAKPDDQDKYLGETECRQLLAFVRARADIERRRGLRMGRAITTELAILLMVGAGLRVSEVCELQMGPNINAGVEGKLRLIGKGVKKRTVAIGPHLGRRVQNYARARANQISWRDLPLAVLLVNEKGKPFVRQTLYSRVKTAGRMAGIRICKTAYGTRLYPHMLRHTHGRYFLDETGDSKQVRDQLGHTSETTTDMYARTHTEVRAPGVKRVEDRLFAIENKENPCPGLKRSGG